MRTAHLFLALLIGCAGQQRVIAPALTARCGDAVQTAPSVTPSARSPRRVAVSIETLGTASGSTTPRCAASTASFRVAVLERLLKAG